MNLRMLTTKSFEKANLFKDKIWKDLETIQKGEIIGIMAPTGVGKTYSIISYFSNNTQENESSLIILPTQFACDSWYSYRSKQCKIWNATKALQFLQRSTTNTIVNFVLDEAHMDNKEYYALFLYLRQKIHHGEMIRLFLVSATLPKEFVSSMFPSVRFLEYPLDNLYYINIEYVDHIHAGYVNKKSIYQEIVQQIINNQEKEKKILCFVATHDDCEEVFELLNEKIKKPILILHGGLEKEEKKQITTHILSMKEYIMICTNIAESSVTIPDLDLIIDSCIECRMNFNRFEVVYASKMCLIQRAGRCGRTQDGRVIRLMHKDDFDMLEEDKMGDHNLDSVVLTSYFYDKCPIEEFGEEIIPFVDYLDNLGMDKEHISKKKIDFLMNCRLQAFSAQMVWNLIHSKIFTRMNERAFIFFSIVMLDYHDRKLPKWLYVRKKTSAQKKTLYYRIQELCNFDHDFLISQVRMILSMMYQDKKWRDFASELSFNQKTVREFFGLVMFNFRYVFPQYDSLKSILPLSIRKNRIVNIPYPLIESCRKFFMMYSNQAPTIFTTPSIRYETFNNLGDNFIPDKNVQTIRLRSGHLIWVNLPREIILFQNDLQARIITYKLECIQKQNTRNYFKHVLNEIDNEVSYRPNMKKMLETMEDFYRFLQLHPEPLEEEI